MVNYTEILFAKLVTDTRNVLAMLYTYLYLVYLGRGKSEISRYLQFLSVWQGPLSSSIFGCIGAATSLVMRVATLCIYFQKLGLSPVLRCP